MTLHVLITLGVAGHGEAALAGERVAQLRRQCGEWDQARQCDLSGCTWQ